MNEQPKLDIDAAIPAVVCERCQKPFEPRATGNGGSKQKFCSDTCRKQHHKATASKGDAGGDAGKFEGDAGRRDGDAGNLEPPAAKLPAEPSKPTVKPAPVHNDTFDFNWSQDGDAVVVPHQAAIAVYENPRGEIVIRQEGHYGPDEDHWIVVSRENLVALILRLQEISGEFHG
jgi:hypothetical protein